MPENRYILLGFGGCFWLVLVDCLEDGPQWLEETSPELFESLVRRIVIAPADTLKFTLLNGLELTERIGKAVR